MARFVRHSEPLTLPSVESISMDVESVLRIGDAAAIGIWRREDSGVFDGRTSLQFSKTNREVEIHLPYIPKAMTRTVGTLTLITFTNGFDWEVYDEDMEYQGKFCGDINNTTEEEIWLGL